MDSENIEIFINKFFCVKSDEELNLDLVLPIARRRLSRLDKYTLTVLNNVYSEDCENIIFSSKEGESERLKKIIEQYTEFKEVSPNIFTGSVHNYPAGFFLWNKQTSVPYNCLSAGNKSISAGFLAAVCSEYNNTIYCYSDFKDGNTFSFGIGISHSSGFAKYKITFHNSEVEDNFEDYIDLFQNKKSKIETPFFIIERV